MDNPKACSKRLAILLGLLLYAINLGIPSQALAQQLSIDIKGVNLPGGTSYTDQTNVQTGQRVKYSISVLNTEIGTSAQNTLIKVNLPTNNQKNHTVTATVSSPDATTASDTTNVTITDSTGKLTLKGNTTVLVYWNNGTSTWENILLSDVITTTGFNIGELRGGNTYTLQLVLETNVVQGVDQPVQQPTPTPAPAPSSQAYSLPGGPYPAPVCNDAVPKTINLLSTERVSSSSAKLTWTKNLDANKFAIVYGIAPRSYQHGVVDLQNITEYTINHLVPSFKYHFSVLPINGCMPGPWSNEQAAEIIQEFDVSQSNVAVGQKTEDLVKKQPEVTPSATITPTQNPLTVFITNIPKKLQSPFNFKLKEAAVISAIAGILFFAALTLFKILHSTPSQPVKNHRKVLHKAKTAKSKITSKKKFLPKRKK